MVQGSCKCCRMLPWHWRLSLQLNCGAADERVACCFPPSPARWVSTGWHFRQGAWQMRAAGARGLPLPVSISCSCHTAWLAALAASYCGHRHAVIATPVTSIPYLCMLLVELPGVPPPPHYLLALHPEPSGMRQLGRPSWQRSQSLTCQSLLMKTKRSQRRRQATK